MEIFSMKNHTMRILIGVLLLLFFIIMASGCSVIKRVRTREFEQHKKEIIGKYHIKKMDVTFMRPSITINYIADENVNKEDLANVMDELKPLINVKHMQEIADRYWVKNSQIYTVYVNFYTGDQDRDNVTINRKYYLYTLYRKHANGYDIPENIDGFQTWFIEMNHKTMLLQDYLDGKLPRQGEDNP